MYLSKVVSKLYILLVKPSWWPSRFNEQRVISTLHNKKKMATPKAVSESPPVPMGTSAGKRLDMGNLAEQSVLRSKVLNGQATVITQQKALNTLLSMTQDSACCPKLRPKVPGQDHFLRKQPVSQTVHLHGGSGLSLILFTYTVSEFPAQNW